MERNVSSVPSDALQYCTQSHESPLVLSVHRCMLRGIVSTATSRCKSPNWFKLCSRVFPVPLPSASIPLRSFALPFVKQFAPMPYTILADDQAIAKPLLDTRKYRFLQLNENKLHVLVIHDADADRAGASLDVGVGSFADAQYSVSGLAHFCEHLLFMGTEKYPEENDYSSFLADHLGQLNAYTAAEHTNYFFEVDSAHLEPAVDRFAQFFISPLFSKSCKDREIRAVDSENKKNLQNDMWRLYQLDKSLSNPQHPYNGFSTGNLHTLNDDPLQKGWNVRDILLDYYREQYSANIMSLVILGKESLDELSEMASSKFSPIPNRDLATSKEYAATHLYTENNLGKLIQAKSIMDSHKLELSFYIPDDMEKLWRIKPGQYFSHLIGHESNGSLLRFLQAKNWVVSLLAGSQKVCAGASLFMVDLELTPEGLAHWEHIVVHVFEYLNMLKSEGPQQWVWQELADMSRINFRFKQKTSTSSTVSKMSNLLYKFTEGYNIPPENLLDALIMRDFDALEIDKFGSFLNPENLRVTLTSQNFEELPKREKWYGTEFSYGDLSATLREEISSVGLNKNFHLPQKNKFIPKDFEIYNQKSDAPMNHPLLIKDTPKFETWLKQDDRFTVPKGYINLKVHLPPLHESLNNTVMGNLLSELFDDHLNDLKYYASMVGLNCDIYQMRDSYVIKLGGYNDKLPEFLKQVVEEFVKYLPEKDRFDSIKYKFGQSLKNFGYQTPYYQIGTRFLHFVNDKTYTHEEKYEAVNKLAYEDVLGFAKDSWAKGVFVQTLIHGNFRFSTASEVSTFLEKVFADQPAIETEKKAVAAATEFHSYKLSKGEHLRYEVDLQDSENINSCVEYFLQIGDLGQDTRDRVLTHLVCTMLHEPCFNQLRTKEQLGYVVFSGFRLTRTYYGFRVLVQSEMPCEFLEYRIEEFLQCFQTKNLSAEELTDEAFAKFKKALASKNLTKLKNLHEESSRFWSAITDGYYDFTQKEDDVEILETITKDEFLEFFARVMSPETPRLNVYLKPQRVPALSHKKAAAIAIKNYLHKHAVRFETDAVDELLDTMQVEEVVHKIAAEASIQVAPFLAETKARTAAPVPPAFPGGKPVERQEFKASHSTGKVPHPVRDLKSFYPECHL